LRFFYTQYIVQFALIGVCRKCLPFIDNLGNRSKVKELLPQHCAFETKKQIILNPRDWFCKGATAKKPKNDQFTRDEYVKVLGLQFNGAIIGNSVPRTFQDCMEAILYQKKKIKKKSRDSKWWDFFDLENFATLFDKHAGEAIADRKTDFMISDEDSVDDSGPTFEGNASNSSPKLQLHNTLLATFKESRPAEKMFLFQNAIINLLSATDDDTTKGTVQINRAQAKILQQVTMVKSLSLSSITAQTNSGTSFPNGMEESDPEQNTRTNHSYSSDDEKRYN